MVWLLVGLGNPGVKYANNRHNIGFMVLDELARRHGGGGFRQRFGGEVLSAALSVGGRMHKSVLLKPMEFMNRSGYAVSRAVSFYDVDIEHILVVHDEIDIEFGRLKLKGGGGPGGHNGLRSMIEQLGGRDFLRVRVGVGKPEPLPGSAGGDPRIRDRRVASHVLSDFPAELHDQVSTLIDRAADATETIIAQGLREAMNQFHKPEANSV